MTTPPPPSLLPLPSLLKVELTKTETDTVTGYQDDNHDDHTFPLLLHPQVSTPTQSPSQTGVKRSRKAPMSLMSFLSLGALVLVVSLFNKLQQYPAFQTRKPDQHEESHYQYRQRSRNLGQKFNKAIKSRNFADYSCEDMHQLRASYYGGTDMKIIVDSNSNEKKEANASYSQLEQPHLAQQLPSPYLYYSVAHFECDFANTCNDGEGIFLPMVFCGSTEAEAESQAQDDEGSSVGEDVSGSSYFQSKQFLLWSTSIPLIILLFVLFRVLGSTGEEFFSPSLELYSLKLGLPERFAGVTLLALGNGAPDVASTVSAIINDKHRGYLMALGELTGAAMVSTTLIVGAVTYVAYTNLNDTSGSNGVLCGGSLVRDVMVFIVTMIWVYLSFEDGTISQMEIKSFVWLYVIYCGIVLASDLYHKYIIVPRRRSATQKQLMDGHSKLNLSREYEDKDVENGGGEEALVADESTSLLSATPKAIAIGATSTKSGKTKPISIRLDSTSSDTSGGSVPPGTASASRTQQIHRRSATDQAQQQKQQNPTINWSISDIIMEAISNYDADSTDGEAGDEYPIVAHTPSAALVVQPKIARESETENPLLNRTVDIDASSNHSISQRRRVAAGSWGQNRHDGSEPLIVFHPHHGGVVNLKHHNLQPILIKSDSSSQSDIAIGAGRLTTKSGSSLEDTIVAGQSPENWCHAIVEGWKELTHHFYKQLWTETIGNDSYNAAEKLIMVCELPFTILRMLSTPVPCDGYYNRPLVGISIALSPLWIWYYCSEQFDIDIVSGEHWIVSTLIFAIPLMLGMVVLRYAPCGEIPLQSTLVVVPISFIGFVVSATWLDLVADHLVDLLSYFGIILHIPSTIIGITILAWGNSSQDMIANITIARKGLSTMAITASFAGPLFNILVGLGIGFTILGKQELTLFDDSEEGFDNLGKIGHEKFVPIPVSLNNPLRIGFLFAVINGFLVLFMGICIGKGTIPKYYGYVALAIYSAYGVATITV